MYISLEINYKKLNIFIYNLFCIYIYTHIHKKKKYIYVYVYICILKLSLQSLFQLIRGNRKYRSKYTTPFMLKREKHFSLVYYRTIVLHVHMCLCGYVRCCMFVRKKEKERTSQQWSIYSQICVWSFHLLTVLFLN